MKRPYLKRIPARFRDANLKDVDPKVYGEVLTYFKNWPDMKRRGVGVLLCGAAGTGKTWTTCALTIAIGEVEKNFKCEFVTAPQFFDRIHPVSPDGFDEYRDQTWEKTYSTIPYLVINDLGKEYRSGKYADQVAYSLGKIVRIRSENLLVTHYTSNLGIKKDSGSSGTLVDTYGSSVVSLLRETVIPITIVGQDRRRSPSEL